MSASRPSSQDAAGAVAAEQEPVADDQLEDEQVRLELVGAVDRAEDQVAVRVHPRLVLGDPALVDESLHEGVVAGQPADLAVAEEVGPAVADVAHAGPVAVEERDRRRRARAARARGPRRRARRSCRGRGAGPSTPGRAGGPRRRTCSARRLVESAQLLDRGRRGDVAARRAADPVADGEQVGAGVAGVLVVLADPADVGDRAVVELHFLSSRIVLPMRTWVPRVMVVGLVDPDRADVGAVGGAEVLDEPLVAAGGDPGVPGRHVVVVELDRGVGTAADQDRRVLQLGALAGVAALDHQDVRGGAAALRRGLGLPLATTRFGGAGRLGHAGAEHVGADHRDRGQDEDPEDREVGDPDQEQGELRHRGHRARRRRRRPSARSSWCCRPVRRCRRGRRPGSPCGRR